jgi:putative hemolysin
MAAVATEILIIFLLILANGLLAMVEMAVVSARKARLQLHADEGDAGASAALELARNPSDFMSTVQIGITLIGVLAGAFGGATIAGQIAAGLRRIPILAPYSQAISVTIVVVTITYLTLVIGELAPKRFAISNAEQIAARLARPMQRLSRIFSPVSRFLSLSAGAILRLLSIQPTEQTPVTEEEIKIMLAEGTKSGIFEPLEEKMVDHVFRLGERKVSALFKPRTEVVWIDVQDSEDEIHRKVTSSGHSRFPVAEGELDHVLGIVLAKDLLAQSLACQPIDLKSILQPVPFVPESLPAFDLLETFKAARSKIALVLDEYGGIQGLVTTDDLLEAIVGDIPGLGEQAEAEIIQRDDGSWLLDGHLPLDEFVELSGLAEPLDRSIDTLGGLVMSLLGRIPSHGDQLEWEGLRLEVIDMDGHRVDKVLMTPIKSPPQEDSD